MNENEKEILERADELEDIYDESLEEAKKDDVINEEANEVEDIVVEDIVEEDDSNSEDVLKARISELENEVARAHADAQNTMRKAKIDMDIQVNRKVSNIVEHILPALDNFERALNVKSDDANLNNFLKGFEMIYQQLYSALEGEGIKRIEAVGQDFNPEFHQAVSTVKDENFESGKVVEELAKGYTFKDKVLRHTLVKVNE